MPSHSRVQSLATTMNFFDVLLLLRVAELLDSTNLTLPELLGSTLPMARATLLVLPCDVDDDAAAIEAGVRASEGNKVGLQAMNYTLEPIAEFAAGDCRKRLWRLELTGLQRGVKHTWCEPSPPWSHKFNLLWTRGQKIGLQFTSGIHKGKVPPALLRLAHGVQIFKPE